jgi:predicted double-glycine peptidase
MSYSNGPRIVTDGLVLCLDAANTKSYPGSGNVWYDLSGKGNNGQLSSVDFNTDKSLNFNSSADTIQIIHNNTFNFNSFFSIFAWIRINSDEQYTANNNIFNVISKKNRFNSTQPGWSFQYDFRTNGILQFRNNDGTVTNDSTPTSPTNNRTSLGQQNTYKYVGVTINNNTLIFYIDSINKGTVNKSYANIDSLNDIYIGKVTTSNGDNSLFMDLSNIHIYNKVLSTLEINQNYKALKGRFGLF